MEFDDLIVKESPGLCRCCLSEGCYKELGSEYSWMGDTEVYADMLWECFDISISHHNEGPNGPSRLICEVCITRLRDACNFKKQVVESEKKFVEMVSKGEFRPKVVVFQPDMKLELGGAIPESVTREIEYLEDEMDFGDDELLRSEDAIDPSAMEDITVSALPMKGKRGRPKKSEVKVEKKKAKAEEKPKTSKAVAKGPKTDTVENRLKKAEWGRKLMIKRRNIEYVLQYSNVTPFIWYKSKYRCFFCTEPMKTPALLREHTEKMHQYSNLELVVYDRTKNNRNKDAAVKIDVTDMQCRLCNNTITTLEELIHHLIIAHDAEYDVTVPNCLLPFKLDKEPTCPICNTKFVFFEYLLRHANKNHLAHDYICDVCGTSFQGENHLKMHNRYYHRAGGYPCEKCGLHLATLAKKLQHEKSVHAVNLSTCPHCPETFKSPYFKKLHLANVHGVEELKFACPYCPKVYPQESIMSRHMRRVHLREKNVKCDVCGDRFFGAYDLKLHMFKHSMEKKFVCATCGKRFAKKSNLNSHSNVHTENRYPCLICNKLFSHPQNLRSHKKNQHPQLEVAKDNEDVDETEISTVEFMDEADMVSLDATCLQ